MNRNLNPSLFGGRPYKMGRTRTHSEGFYGSEEVGTQGQMITGGHAHPWPRGYTPERKREVEAAMPPVTFSSDTSTKPVEERGAPGRSMGELSLKDDKRNLGQGAAVVRDALARSTASVKPLGLLDEIQIAPRIASSGVYLPGSRTMQFNYDADAVDYYRWEDIPLQQSIGQGQTVVHEFGHVSDARLLPLRGQRNAVIDRTGENPVEGYVEPRDLGSIEQFADDFAVEHFRHDPRAPKRHQINPEEVTYPGRNVYRDMNFYSYQGWEPRSERAMHSILARERQGHFVPKTSDQERRLSTMKLEKRGAEPRLFAGPYKDSAGENEFFIHPDVLGDSNSRRKNFVKYESPLPGGKKVRRRRK